MISCEATQGGGGATHRGLLAGRRPPPVTVLPVTSQRHSPPHPPAAESFQWDSSSARAIMTTLFAPPRSSAKLQGRDGGAEGFKAMERRDQLLEDATSGSLPPHTHPSIPIPCFWIRRRETLFTTKKAASLTAIFEKGRKGGKETTRWACVCVLRGWGVKS